MSKTQLQMIKHESMVRPNAYGGHTYRTLCGRTNRRCNDGMNVAEEGEQVTCKLCLKKLKEIKP